MGRRGESLGGAAGPERYPEEALLEIYKLEVRLARPLAHLPSL